MNTPPINLVVGVLGATLVLAVALLGLLAWGDRAAPDSLQMIATGALGALAGILTRPSREK